MVEILFKSLKGDTLKVFDSYKPGCWVNVVNPSQQELDEVVSQLGLDMATVKDALDPNEVPRVEREDGFDYIFVRTPVEVAEQIYTVPLLIVITPDHFVTISRESLDLTVKLKEKFSSLSTTQKTKLFISLLLEINSVYSQLVNSMRKKVRHITTDLQKISNSDIVALVNFQSIFNDFLSSLEPLSIIFSQLLSGKYLKLYEADEDLVEDLKIGTDQLVRLCFSNIKAIANIREAYTSIISNNLNRTMKLLTAVTLILTIPTAIASFFGMNVPVPMSENPLAFALIILLTLGLTALIWIIFWKRDYL